MAWNLKKSKRKGAWARWPGKVLSLSLFFCMARSTVYSRTQRNIELARIKFLFLYILCDVRASLMFLCLFLFTVHKAKLTSVYAYSALDRERKRKWCSGRSPTMAPRPRWPDSVLALAQINDWTLAGGHRGTSFLLFLFFLARSSIICMCVWLSWPRSVRSVLALSLRTKRKRTQRLEWHSAAAWSHASGIANQSLWP